MNTLRIMAAFDKAARTRELAADPLTRMAQRTGLRHGSIYKLLKVLNGVLLVSVVLHLGLCLHGFTGEPAWFRDKPVPRLLYLLSVILLVAFFVANFLLQLVFASRAETTNQRIDAMIHMFSSVKHSLNNDMQVVRGNAELAQLASEQGDSASKQIRHIVLAADDAIDRIEQLGAFNISGAVKLRPADLNAALRQTMAKLTAQLPETVALELDLVRLDARVMVDRFLLELSLSHLIRSTARLLPDGCEILVRTHCARAGRMSFATGVKTKVKLDVIVCARQVVPDKQPGKSAPSDVAPDFHYLQSELQTSKALLEASGASLSYIKTRQQHLQLQLTFCCSQNDPETRWRTSDLSRQDTPIRIPAANTSEPPSTT